MRAEVRTIEGHEFWRVGALVLRRTADGDLDEYRHDFDPSVALNAHAAGPFCYLSLAAAPASQGVYAIFVAGDLKYIGECQDLMARFGPMGYGQIHPRNCHADGQSTNCKLNSRILAAAKGGLEAEVCFVRLQTTRKGLRAVRIRAGDLHAHVGGYPGPNHRMVSCCSAMRAEMGADDRIVAQPPKGNGASLLIDYSLPRETVGPAF